MYSAPRSPRQAGGTVVSAPLLFFLLLLLSLVTCGSHVVSAQTCTTWSFSPTLTVSGTAPDSIAVTVKYTTSPAPSGFIDVFVNGAATAAATVPWVTTSLTQSTTLTGLAAGTSYSITVKARYSTCPTGTSPRCCSSNASSARTALTWLAQVPVTPVLRAHPSTATKMEVTLQAPAHSYTSNPRFVMALSPALTTVTLVNASGTTCVWPAAGTAVVCTVSGLVAGTSYAMVARVAIGTTTATNTQGAWSAVSVSAFTLLSQKLTVAKPTLPTTDATTSLLVSVTSTAAPPANAQLYILSSTDTSRYTTTPSDPFVWPAAATTASVTVVGLTPGTSYAFRAQLVVPNGAVSTVSSASSATSTQLSLVPTVTVETPSSTSSLVARITGPPPPATVSWPSIDLGIVTSTSPLTITKKSSCTWPTDGSASTCTVWSLSSGTGYQLSARYMGSGMTGAWSTPTALFYTLLNVDISVDVENDTPRTQRLKITTSAAINAADASVEVWTWDDANSVLTGKATLQGDPSWPAGATTATVTVAGLEPVTLYSFKVRIVSPTVMTRFSWQTWPDFTLLDGVPVVTPYADGPEHLHFNIVYTPHEYPQSAFVFGNPDPANPSVMLEQHWCGWYPDGLSQDCQIWGLSAATAYTWKVRAVAQIDSDGRWSGSMWSDFIPSTFTMMDVRPRITGAVPPVTGTALARTLIVNLSVASAPAANSMIYLYAYDPDTDHVDTAATVTAPVAWPAGNTLSASITVSGLAPSKTYWYAAQLKVVDGPSSFVSDPSRDLETGLTCQQYIWPEPSCTAERNSHFRTLDGRCNVLSEQVGHACGDYYHFFSPFKFYGCDAATGAMIAVSGAPSLPGSPLASPQGDRCFCDFTDGTSEPLNTIEPPLEFCGPADQLPVRPSARTISNVACSQSTDMPNRYGLTNMFWAFGQFLAHDMDLARKETRTLHNLFVPLPQRADIPLEPGDPLACSDQPSSIPVTRNRFTRLLAEPTDDMPDQSNVVTHFVDASAVYGSDVYRSRSLRSMSGGRLLTSAGPDGDLMPLNTMGLPNQPTDASSAYFVAGDVRASDNLYLMALHALFLREHNRVADCLNVGVIAPSNCGAELLRLRTTLNLSDDEALFQEARHLLIGEYQKIVFVDYLRKIFWLDYVPEAGEPMPSFVDQYEGFVSRNPRVRNEWAHAAFRLHSLVSDVSPLATNLPGYAPIANPNVPTASTFLQTAASSPLSTVGLGPVLVGAATSHAQERDTHVVDALRNFRNCQFGVMFDLAAFNIQRAREHGIPSWWEAFDYDRSMLTFEDITEEGGRDCWHGEHCATGVCNQPGPWQRGVCTCAVDADCYPGNAGQCDASTGVCGAPYAANLRAAYGTFVARNGKTYDNVRLVDLWMGLMSQSEAEYSPFGWLQRQMLRTQFEESMHADRYFYLAPGAYTADELAFAQSRTLTQIIRDNLPACSNNACTEVPEDLFQMTASARTTAVRSRTNASTTTTTAERSLQLQRKLQEAQERRAQAAAARSVRTAPGGTENHRAASIEEPGRDAVEDERLRLAHHSHKENREEWYRRVVSDL